MLLGNLNQNPPDWYPPVLRTMLEFMAATDFRGMAAGQVLLPGIPAEDAYCSVQGYGTRPAQELNPEAHRVFADVHLIVQGREAIGWAPLRRDLPVAKPYDAAGDIEFFTQAPGERFIALEVGDYLVADLDDVHRPRCATQGACEVVKVVGKIRSELLKG